MSKETFEPVARAIVNRLADEIFRMGTAYASVTGLPIGFSHEAANEHANAIVAAHNAEVAEAVRGARERLRAELYELFDGNVGDGLWEWYDKEFPEEPLTETSQGEATPSHES